MVSPIKVAIIGTLAAALSVPQFVRAQETKPARIGILRISQPPPLYLKEFRAGLIERGHVEGRTFVIVPGWGKPVGKRMKSSQLAKRLVVRGVDVIITEGTGIARAAKRAAPTTPIVMASSGDPVRGKLVKSIAAPGGNITGLTSNTVALFPKSLEIFNRIVPDLRHLAILYRVSRNRSGGIRKLFIAAQEQAAQTLGFKISNLTLKKGDDYRALFARARATGVDAVYVRSTPNLSQDQQKRIGDAALAAKLPTMYSTKQLVRRGGLISYGTNRAAMYRSAARYVDKILKGAKPADLPVESPPKMDLVVNLKTAKALGITIPTEILLRADEIIE
jgi:putative ABC transport system substrate-binding protein